MGALNTRISAAGGGGGGSGGSAPIATVEVVGDGLGNFTTTSVGAFVDVDPAFNVTIPAVEGDLIVATLSGTLSSSTGQSTAMTLSIGASADILPNVLYLGAPSDSLFVYIQHTVVPADISGGNVAVSARYRGYTSGTVTLFNETTFNRAPRMYVNNLGQ